MARENVLDAVKALLRHPLGAIADMPSWSRDVTGYADELVDVLDAMALDRLALRMRLMDEALESATRNTAEVNEFAASGEGQRLLDAISGINDRWLVRHGTRKFKDRIVRTDDHLIDLDPL
jgi:hypothetical protein